MARRLHPKESDGGKFISCVVDPTTMKIIYDVFTMSWKCKGVIRVSMNSRVNFAAGEARKKKLA